MYEFWCGYGKHMAKYGKKQNYVKSHPFMTSTKNDQFFDPPTPTIRKNEQ